MPLHVLELRQQLWAASRQNTYAIQLAAYAVGATIPCHDAEQLTQMIKHLQREQPAAPTQIFKLAPVPQIPATQHDWKQRYSEAHRIHAEREYPAACADGHYSPPVYPKTYTANGLTTMIINHLNWTGYRATRINVNGRLIEKAELQESGNTIMVKKMIKSSTRKGSADVSSTIKGRSCMFEVKVGRDKPSEKQIEEQRRERRAGGEYFFVHDPDEYFTLFDYVMSL